MDGGMFRALAPLLIILGGIIIIFVPLGVWKLIDIGIWLFEHTTNL